MKKLTASRIATTLATCLFVAALTVSTSVSAAGARILNEANMDFDNTSSISSSESTYTSERSRSASVLDQNQYDYKVYPDGLEEAEFAAFEVPDALVVSD